MGKATFKYDLSDGWTAAGSDFKQFEALLQEVSARTEFVKIRGEEIVTYWRMPMPTLPNAIVLFRITPESIYDYKMELENKIIHGKQVSGGLPFEIKLGRNSKMDQQLAQESFKNHGFLLATRQKDAPDKLYYIGEFARAMLCRQTNLTGEAMAKKATLWSALHLADEICTQNRPMTMAVRSIDGENGMTYRKVFAVLSDSYPAIPMSILPDTIRKVTEEGTLGKAKTAGWYMDQTFAEIYVEFPEAADDFAEMYGIESVIPGLVVMSSDTGASSVIARGTYRRPGQRRYVIVDKYEHKHAGNITLEDVVNGVNNQVLANIRKLPEALADKIGRVIGNGKVATEKDQAANADAVRAALKKIVMHKTLGIKTELGKKRAGMLLDALCAEIDPQVVYSEYDLAMMLMGVPDRIEGLAREVQTRLAQACGMVPFMDLGGNQAEETITLLPAE